jgi:hypothetical protein
VGSELINSPCVNGKMFDSTFVFTNKVSMISPTTKYEIKGDSKKNKCREEIEQLFAKRPCVSGNDCYFDPAYLPHLQGIKFVVIYLYFFAIIK